MKISRTRSVCVAGASACFILAVLLSTYLLAFNTGSDAAFLKLALLPVCILFVYLGGSALRDQFLGVTLFQNKVFLSVMASFATCASFFCLVLALSCYGRMNLSWLMIILALHTLSTLAAATCFRLAIDVRAFGWVSLLYGLPVGVLSIGPIDYLLFPPPADPVGGAGINAGILIMLMIPFASVGLPSWIAAVYFERWRLHWHVLIALLHLPGALAIVAVFTGIAG